MYDFLLWNININILKYFDHWPLIYFGVTYAWILLKKKRSLEWIFYDFPWDYPQISQQRQQKLALHMLVFMQYIGLSLGFQSFQSQ